MRRVYFLLVFAVAIIIGCKGKNRIPSDILPQKTMQLVLWDMMRADQFINDYVVRQDSNRNRLKESIQYYQKIFAIHKISQEQFDKSFAYYKDHPEYLKSIMDSINVAANVAPTQINRPAPVDTAAPTQRIGL